MTAEHRSASPVTVVGRSAGSATLYALCVMVFGAIAVLLITWIVDQAGKPRVAWGIAAGGSAGILLATAVFCSWLRAVERSMQDVLRAFALGFLVKLVVLVAGTLVVHFLLPALDSSGFAIAFAGGILWVSALGLPYIHRRGVRPRAGGDRGGDQVRG